MKKNVLSFSIVLFLTCVVSAQVNKPAQVKFQPAQDTLYAGGNNLLIVLKPGLKEMATALFEVSGPALASGVAGKPNYYRVYPTDTGTVEIVIRLKGKEIYNKAIKVISIPTEPALYDRWKIKMQDVEKTLKQ